MTTVLDAGGISALAGRSPRVVELINRHEWPPIVPADVLAEALTGDHHRDFHANRLLRRCDIRPITELLARHAAAIRTSAGRSGISAVDAIVGATADHAGGGVILTSDVDDLLALAEHTIHRLRIHPV